MRKQRRRSAVQIDQDLCFDTQIVQSLFFLSPKFQATDLFLILYKLCTVLDLVRNPNDQFSRDMSQIFYSDKASGF